MSGGVKVTSLSGVLEGKSRFHVGLEPVHRTESLFRKKDFRMHRDCAWESTLMKNMTVEGQRDEDSRKHR